MQPKEKTIYPSVISFRLTRSEKKRIISLCDRKGITLSEYFRIITNQINNHKRTVKA
jgi:antitoxin component of RelBE/YafQ-DinJ toxin-antitoxin module